MKIIIIGRTGRGKSTLARLMAEKGLPVLKTCTTRPRRTPSEDTYHFFTEDEFQDLDRDEVCLYTEAVDGYKRFAKRKDVKNACVCVLDPSGLDEILSLCPEESITLIHLSAGEEDIKAHITEDPAYGPDALEIYEKRKAAEDDAFTKLETDIAAWDARDSKPEKQLAGIYEVKNDFTPDVFDGLVEACVQKCRIMKEAVKIVELAADNGILYKNEDDPEKINVWYNDGTSSAEPKELFAASMVLGKDRESLGSILHALLAMGIAKVDPIEKTTG